MTPIQKAIEALEVFAKVAGITNFPNVPPDQIILWCRNDTHGDNLQITYADVIAANEALAALRAVNETHVLVKREPDAVMLEIGFGKMCNPFLGHDEVRNVYKAMIEAAQKDAP